MNVGALPIVRVSTRGAAFGAVEICGLVASKVCSDRVKHAISASMSARISDMADVSGIQCLSLWVRKPLLRYHV